MVIALNEAELEKLETEPILDASLSVCRDVFLFQCYTGFAYCDLAELTPDHLFQSKENQWFIRKNRNKTNETSIVPLLPRALEIVRKYEVHAKMNGLLLPVLSNQKYNDKLKVLAEVLAFNRFPLTTHIARKSCATMFLNKGVPLATVAGVLGHATTKTTEQFYAVMREETIVKQVFDIYNAKAI
jgi:integrase